MASKRAQPTAIQERPPAAAARAEPRGDRQARLQLYQAERGGDPDRHWLQAERELQGG